MRILILGSGGREHALARALAQSPRVSALFTVPGNPGTASVGTNVDMASDDLDGLVAFAHDADVDLTVVGPEKPLVDGVVDRFEEAGLRVVGPTAAAARLEGSKAFADEFMARHGIPTADFRVFEADEEDAAAAYLDDVGAPIVVKASGLAGGKGAFVCTTLDEAHDALQEIVSDRAFGAAGDKVVIEECMEGEEASVFALTDGSHYVLLPPSQDHKPIGEGDTGPNTGGMGAYAPAPVVTGSVLNRVCRTIIEPTLAGMQKEGTPYRGVLYCGLMITDEGPKVVEYNCRFGDPEAQVVLPLVASDLVDVFEAMVEGRMQDVSLEARAGSAACVVLASGGYPIEYETGFEITGLADADAIDGVHVVHAGTRQRDDGTIVTDGGRVLGVTAVSHDLPDVLRRAYEGVEAIDFEGKTYRRDIGQKGLDHLEGERDS
jgi:phosphoribosylamine--glycine ligase